MTSAHDDTEELLLRACSGDTAATEVLFLKNRERLKQAVKLRMDERLTARVDPSNVVQESLLDSSKILQYSLKHGFQSRLGLVRIAFRDLTVAAS